MLQAVFPLTGVDDVQLCVGTLAVTMRLSFEPLTRVGESVRAIKLSKSCHQAFFELALKDSVLFRI